MKYVILVILGTLLGLSDWGVYVGLRFIFLVRMFIENIRFSFHGYFVQDYISFRLISIRGWVVMFCLLSRVAEE